MQAKQMYPERKIKLKDIDDCWVFCMWGILILNSICCIFLNPLYYDKPKEKDFPKRGFLGFGGEEKNIEGL